MINNIKKSISEYEIETVLIGFFAMSLMLYVLFILRVNVVYALIPFVVMFVIRYKEAKIFLILAALVLFSVVFRGEQSDFLIMIGDPSSYLLDGLAYINNTFQSQNHFPPLTSAYSALSMLVFSESYSSILFQIVSCVLLLVFYSTLKNIYSGELLPIITSLALFMSPILILYSKSTYSENVFILFILTTFWVFLTSIKTRNEYVVFILLAFISFLSIQTRGTGIFLAYLILFVSVYKNIFSRKIFYYGLAIVSIASFSLLFFQRYNYTWNWQLSPYMKTLGDIESLYLLSSIFVFILLSKILLSGYDKRYNLINIFSIIMSVIFFVYDAYRFLSSDYSNTVSFFNFHFHWLLLPVMILGYLSALRKAYNGEPAYLFLVLAFPMFGAIILLRNISPVMDHAFWMYWHRYYFSEIFIIHFLYLSVGIHYIINSSTKNAKKIIFVFVSIYSIANAEKIYLAVNNSMYGSADLMYRDIQDNSDYYLFDSSDTHYYYTTDKLFQPYFSAKGYKSMTIDGFNHTYTDNNVTSGPGKITCIAKHFDKCDFGKQYQIVSKNVYNLNSLRHSHHKRTMAEEAVLSVYVIKFALVE